jgi:hypothetical protein
MSPLTHDKYHDNHDKYEYNVRMTNHDNHDKYEYNVRMTKQTAVVHSNKDKNAAKDIQGCIQKLPDWPPGARTASGTALCH